MAHPIPDGTACWPKRVRNTRIGVPGARDLRGRPSAALGNCKLRRTGNGANACVGHRQRVDQALEIGGLVTARRSGCRKTAHALFCVLRLVGRGGRMFRLERLEACDRLRQAFGNGARRPSTRVDQVPIALVLLVARSDGG